MTHNLKKIKPFIVLLLGFISAVFFVNGEEIHPTQLARPLRFFILDYHSSATNDIKEILETLGHTVDYLSISPYCKRIFGHDNHKLDVIKLDTVDDWSLVNLDMFNRFHERYGEFLGNFDGYIVSSFSSFAMLYEKTNKPIIIVNSARYEIPFTDKPELWEILNKFLIDGVDQNKIFLVANNKGDLSYLKYYTGLESEFIPSLCNYTKAKYSGKNTGFVFQNSKLKPFIKSIEDHVNSTGLIQPFPHNFDSWQTLYDFKGIIHFPYQISTMALFEQYTANVPLFFPSKKFLQNLQKNYPHDILNEVSFFFMFNMLSAPTEKGDLNNMNDPCVLQFWIDSADFYDEENMPYIQYFDSIKHLKYLLLTTNTDEISRKMEAHNKNKKKMVFEQWKKLLDKVEQSIDHSQRR